MCIYKYIFSIPSFVGQGMFTTEVYLFCMMVMTCEDPTTSFSSKTKINKEKQEIAVSYFGHVNFCPFKFQKNDFLSLYFAIFKTLWSNVMFASINSIQIGDRCDASQNVGCFGNQYFKVFLAHTYLFALSHSHCLWKLRRALDHNLWCWGFNHFVHCFN